MSKIIVDIDPRELSFIKNEYKGEKWSPVNGDAVVLSVKGEKAEQSDQTKSVVQKIIDTLKGIYFPSSDLAEEAPQTYPVSEDVPDKIDNDGDGAADYSAIALAMCYAAQDINLAMNLNEPARSEAIAAIIDKYNAEYAAQFAEKAGRRHNASDFAQLKSIRDSLNSLLDGVEEEQPQEEKAEAEAPIVAQADDVKEPDEKAAAEPESAPSETETVKAQLEALITAKAAEFEQQIATVKAEAQAQIGTLKAESESRVAELESQLKAATTRAESAESAVKAIVGEARKPSSPGFVPTLREDGKRDDPAAEVAKGETLANIGKPSSISEVIKLQRLANS